MRPCWSPKFDNFGFKHRTKTWNAVQFLQVFGGFAKHLLEGDSKIAHCTLFCRILAVAQCYAAVCAGESTNQQNADKMGSGP